MKPLLLSLLLAVPAGAADDITFLYGPERGQTEPNRAQLLNRRFTLLEHALIHEVMISYGNDVRRDEQMAQLLPDYRPTPKTGYHYDRRAKHDQAWRDYNAATEAMRTQDRARRTTGAALDPAPADALAANWRPGLLKQVAEAYMNTPRDPAEDEMTPDGLRDYARRVEEARPRLKLTDFEAGLLFQYLRFTPKIDEMMREHLSTVIPQTLEDRYKAELRVANSRALLRARLKDYLAAPPSGAADPEAQYAETLASLDALLADDRAVLDPLFARAGMTAPSLPVPAPTPANPAPVAFVNLFTDQEHALLSYMTLASPQEFDADRAEADADADKAAGLADKWKGRVLAEAQAYLAAPAADRADPRGTLDRLTLLESVYLHWRLERMDASFYRQLQRLGTEADAEAASGNAESGTRLVADLRRLVREDLRTYADSRGARPDAALRAWAQDRLKDGVSLVSLYPRPAALGGNATPDAAEDRSLPLAAPGAPAPRSRPGIAEALARLPLDPVEKAVLEYLALDDAQIRARVEAGQTAELKKAAAAAIGAHLASPDAALESFLRGRAARESLLAYYCPLLTAATRESSAFEQLRRAAHDARLAVSPAAPEAAAVLGDMAAPPQAAAACTAWYAGKTRPASDPRPRQASFTMGRTPARTTDLDRSVPETGSADSKTKDEPFFDKETATTAAVSGALGAGVGLFMAALFGLSFLPFVGVVLGLAVATAAAGTLLIKSEQRKRAG